MSVFNRRNKLLTIRLSDEEYGQVVSVCTLRGARSVSDFVREAVMQLMATPRGRNGDAAVLSRIQELDERVSVLQSEVSRLSVKLGQSACD